VKSTVATICKDLEHPLTLSNILWKSYSFHLNETYTHLLSSTHYSRLLGAVLPN